jgi:hypothetical protein
MNEANAREILKDYIWTDGGLSCRTTYWRPGCTNADLKGYFTADTLEAIAWWMRNTVKPVTIAHKAMESEG